MDPTLRVTLHLDPELHDLLVAELTEYDFDAFQSEGDRLRAYGPGGDWDRTARAHLEDVLRSHDQPATVDEEWISPQNWNARWESEVEPVAVGRFVIAPSWRRDEIESDETDRTVIEIDPKMSFGTGHHPSTRLALRLAERSIERGDRVLDAGAGTGVLSVAAVRLGAARAVAFDNSPPAYENGRETLARNGVADRVDYRMGELSVVDPEDRFEVVLANINRDVLVGSIGELGARLVPGGCLVLSGFLEEARGAMREALGETDLELVDEETEEDWVAWTVRRSAARVATVDVGTNTVLLLVAALRSERRLETLDRRERFARLGEGVDEHGVLDDAAIGRVVEVVGAYRDVAGRYEVDAVVAGGTSAVRDARNADELRRRVEDATGVSIRPLTGEEEGTLTFRGALSARRARPGSYVVVDVGGGSTEFMGGRLGKPGDRPVLERRVSVDVGAVRLSERYLADPALDEPPANAAVRRMRDFLRSELEEADPPRDGTLIGASGTTIALALLDRDVDRWSDLEERPVVLTYEDVVSWRRRLEKLSPTEVLALRPKVMEGREDVFTAGVLILETYLDLYGARTIEVVSRGMRHGLALAWGFGDGVGPTDAAPR